MFHVLCLAALLGAQVLDFDMTPEEKRKAGVNKLSDKEKASLQNWIDTHYIKRDEPLVQDGQIQALLQENLNSGRMIRLNDESLWEIQPSDTPITQGWITAVDIIVSKIDDSDYPYKLTNSLTGSTVRARKAGAQSSPPPKPSPAKK